MTGRVILCVLSTLLTALSAQAEQIELSRTSKCTTLTRHVPDADVTYRPGADSVAGKPVAPADLPADLAGGAAAITMPQDFDIEIDAPLGQADAAASAQDRPLYQPRAKVGRVQVRDLEGDTALDFNGQPLYRAAPGVAAPECAK